MKFNDIEHFDHFPDETIFWAELADPPAELRNKAILIDGDNYCETCFGVCAVFDAKAQRFDLIADMDGDETHIVYYIDNDGDKHWFACEIPEELKNRIFSECQQILNFQKVEGGYEIKECIQFEDGSGFVLAENPDSKHPFLTAHFTEADRAQRYYGERKFFDRRNDAIEDFSQHTNRQKQFLCVKPGQLQAGERPKKDTKQANGRTNRRKHKQR